MLEVCMEIETVDRAGYRILRVKEDLTSDSDLTDLKTAVKLQIDDSVRNIAISFTEKSYFYSRTIAVLVQFLGLIKELEGNLAIIHPDAGKSKMLTLIGLGKLIQTFTDENELKSTLKTGYSVCASKGLRDGG
jgi:hypothetical protein